MSAAQNKATIAAIMQALNAQNYDALDELVADDFTRHCQATPGVVVTNREAFKEFDKGSRSTFPDQELVLQRTVGEGDFVGFWASYRATQAGPMGPHAPTNRRVEIDFGGIFRFADGKAAEVWVTWDNAAMFAQLGLTP